MVNDKLVEVVREKIKLGMTEGAIKSYLLQKGEFLDDIDEVIQREMNGVESKVQKKVAVKKGGLVKGLLLTILGVVISLGLAFGGLKLYEYLRDRSKTEELVPVTPTITKAAAPAGSVPYRTGSSIDLLSSVTYVNKEDGFSIRPPKDWEVDTSGKLGAPIFFFSPKSSVQGKVLYKPSINVQTGLAKGHVLDGYKQFYVDDLKQKLEDLQILEERKLILSGRDALLMKISFTTNGLKLKGEVLLMVSIDTAFVATGLDLESHWSEVETMVETSLYTFNLL